MGPLKEFSIALSNSAYGIFTPGQVIQGTAVVDLSEPMKVRAVQLVFVGVANVAWSEKHNKTTYYYKSSEVYFNDTVVLYGQQTGQGENPVHPKGRHTYKFSFQLPPNIPASFVGLHGGVEYGIKGCIDKPWALDHDTTLAFQVVGNLDLNQERLTLETFQGSDSKTLCCCCCASGPLTCTLALDRCGYVPGQKIHVKGECGNGSSRTVRSFAEITQWVNFISKNKSKCVANTVIRMDKGEIPKGSSEIWNDLIEVPQAITPTGLEHCSIIDIKYQLRLVLDPSGPAFDLVVPAEIVIGTIPLGSDGPLPLAVAQPTGAPGGYNIVPPAPAPARHGMPPPSD